MTASETRAAQRGARRRPTCGARRARRAAGGDTRTGAASSRARRSTVLRPAGEVRGGAVAAAIPAEAGVGDERRAGARLGDDQMIGVGLLVGCRSRRAASTTAQPRWPPSGLSGSQDRIQRRLVAELRGPAFVLGDADGDGERARRPLDVERALDPVEIRARVERDPLGLGDLGRRPRPRGRR